MSKQAFSIAEDETQEGRGLVPSGGAPEEMPVHAKARPIPRISIQAFCEDAATAAVVQAATADRQARQGARQRAHGRRYRGRCPLSRKPHAEPHRHRDQPAARRNAGRARPARAVLRCRHQGGRDRPYQRCRALPGAAQARRQRVSDRPDHPAAAHREPVQPLQQPRHRSRRQRHRLHRRQGRRGLEHGVPQHRLGHVRDLEVECDRGRPGPRLRHHRPRLQPGPRTGHRRGLAEPRAPRRGAARPAADQVLRASEHLRGARGPRPRLRNLGRRLRPRPGRRAPERALRCRRSAARVDAVGQARAAAGRRDRHYRRPRPRQPAQCQEPDRPLEAEPRQRRPSAPRHQHGRRRRSGPRSRPRSSRPRSTSFPRR